MITKQYSVLLCIMQIIINVKIIHTEDMPYLLKYQNNITHQTGATFKLICPIILKTNQKLPSINKPSIMYEWTVRDVGNDVMASHPRYTFTNESRVIKVTKAEVSDTGEFICRGSTGFGSKRAKFNINILENDVCPSNGASYNKRRPCFINRNMQESKNKIKTIHRNVGSSVTLDCGATGNPMPKYRWLYGSTLVPWVTNDADARRSSLVLNNVQDKYSGHYVCQVDNGVGKISFTFALVVKDSPLLQPKIAEEMENVTVSVGAYAELTGRIHCQCNPIIQWLHRVDKPSSSLSSSSSDVDSSSSPTRGSIALPEAAPSEIGESFIMLDVKRALSNKYADYQGVTTESITVRKGLYLSKLKFASVQPWHAGKYVLLTMSPKKIYLDNINYKIVFLNVIADKSFSLNNKANSPPKIIIYIAVPLGILLLSIFLVFYCFIRRNNSAQHNSSSQLYIDPATKSIQKSIQSNNTQYNHNNLHLLQQNHYHTTTMNTNNNNTTTMTSSLQSNQLTSNYSSHTPTTTQPHNVPLLLNGGLSSNPSNIVPPAPSSNNSSSIHTNTNNNFHGNASPGLMLAQPHSNTYNYYNPYHHQQSQLPNMYPSVPPQQFINNHSHSSTTLNSSSIPNSNSHHNQSLAASSSGISSKSRSHNHRPNPHRQRHSHHNHHHQPQHNVYASTDQASTDSSSIITNHCQCNNNHNNGVSNNTTNNNGNGNFQLPPSLCFDTDNSYPSQYNNVNCNSTTNSNINNTNTNLSSTPYFPGHNSSSSASLTYS